MSETPEESLPFWEQPETVARFSGRDPDHRLQELVRDYPDPAATRVLDLGCAGGRNTVFLAERGFDVVAVDRSEAMLAETRTRLAGILEPDEIDRRLRRATMDHLEHIDDRSVDLIVAVGILHSAASRKEWNAALSEIARVLKPGGRLLVANHTDECDVDGHGLTRVPGDDPLYDRRSGRNFLVSAEVLDQEMDAHGLTPVVSTVTVRRETEGGGCRVTANGLYVRGPATTAEEARVLSAFTRIKARRTVIGAVALVLVIGLLFTLSFGQGPLWPIIFGSALSVPAVIYNLIWRCPACGRFLANHQGPFCGQCGVRLR
jgi:SAM-dependent methyltransferase